jgi:hypothetical protein
MTDREEAKTNSTAAANRVRELLDGRSQPFWTTTAGPGIRPYIKIECEDLRLLNALDDFLKSCVREAEL